MIPPRHANTRVLIVDDRREIHDEFAEMLRRPASPVEFELLHATNGERACNVIRRGREWDQPIAVVFIDVGMPAAVDAIEPVRCVRRADRDVQIVIITAYAGRLPRAIVHGAELPQKLLYVRRPFVREEVQQLALCLVDKWNVERELVERESAERDSAERESAQQPRRLHAGHRRPRAVPGGTGELIGIQEESRDPSVATDADRAAGGGHRPLITEGTRGRAEMVGTSPAMRQVCNLLNRAAEADITVLLRGESGTGKELGARSLHLLGPRRGQPFVVVDCTAIPEALVESELFGHELGAFTGAATRRIGAFERADRGTILLDEIGEMPYALQSKLLRVLQERRIQRVGGDATIRVDIRVVAATNKDLEHAVDAGEFRADLFYRIAAFPIVIPPLRERREDLPLLARHFLSRHAARAGKSITDISTAAMLILLRYDWPGNVRELENAIERAVLLEQETVLQASSLPPRLTPIVAPGGGRPAPAYVPTLEEVERQALVHALEVAGYHVERAAARLGVSRATLYRKLKKHGLATFKAG